MADLSREVGRHAGIIDGLQKDVAEVKADVKTILAAVNQSKGGWKVMVFMCSLAGTCGGVAVKLASALWFLPK